MGVGELVVVRWRSKQWQASWFDGPFVIRRQEEKKKSDANDRFDVLQ